MTVFYENNYIAAQYGYINSCIDNCLFFTWASNRNNFPVNLRK